MSHPRIERLSATDIAQIQSSVIITSLQDVVLGLVKNSLDAGATSIEVQVNFSRGNCEVKDDGHGIAMSDFAENGALLKQYSTSKGDAIELHGRHGMFLTSVGSMALLTISSSQRDGFASSSITLHHSKVISRRRFPPEDRSRQLREQGTVVTVRDLFSNMPVRVKQRDLLAEGNELAREFASLTHDLLALLLAWPYLISLELLDEYKDCKLAVKRKSPGTNVEMSQTSHAASIYHLLSILTQANIIESPSWPSWVPVSASTSSLRIRGAISLDPAATKRQQFISFGVVPLRTSESSNELFAEINRVFHNSRFGVIGDAVVDDAELQQRSKDRRFKQDGFTDRQLQGGRKGIERWPMFCFKVSIKQMRKISSTQRLRPEEEPQIARVIDLVGAMVTQWLVKHHFRPLKWRPRGKSKDLQHLRPTTPIGGFAVRLDASPAMLPALETSTLSKRPLSGHALEHTPICSPTRRTTDGPYLTWVHPLTKQEYLIDKQNGAVSPFEVTGESIGGIVTHSADVLMPPKKSVRLEARARSAEDRHQNAWVQNVLAKWDNPVFAKCRHTIPQVNLENPEDGVNNSITGLDKAQIISQLDKKFILIKVSCGGGSPAARDSNLLVVVDQHAADERIKIEALLRDICTGLDLVKLQTPLRFEVSVYDSKSLKAVRDHFLRWGIIYDLEPETSSTAPDTNNGKYVQLMVTKLPAGIAERCNREPRLLLEMLRSEALHRSENNRKNHGISRDTSDPADRHSWLRQITACPTALLDMLNSRACRSAIMFNDHLDLQQCKDLISKLSECALPFQCAHGRPSMVPLIDIGHVQSPVGALGTFNEYSSGASVTQEVNFVATFKAWREQSLSTRS